MTSATGSTLPGGSRLADLRIAGVRFDVARNLLLNGSVSRHLAPREAGVLAMLVRERPGRVLSRAKLLDSVWREHEVGDEALTVIISRLRRHFRLLGIEEPVIETVPKVGYRLISRPEMSDHPGAAKRDSGKADAIARIALLVAVLALGIAVIDLVL